MLHNKVRLTALAGCAVSVLIIAGCGAREPVEAPPASSGTGYGAAQTPELMGAPPAAETTPADGLLGGPAPAAAPVAATAPAPVVSSNPNLKTWRRADGTLVTAMAPIANPKATRYAPRAVSAPARRAHAAPAPVAKPAAKPVVASAPAPVKPVVAPKPAVVPAKAPAVAAAVAPVAAAKPAPPKPLTKLEKLQAAVAPEATKGATLATAESLTQGKEGQVTLSLPATLGDLIKKEAAKLGLTKSAKKTSAYADLQGQGYEITPNGRQTAEVKAGEPATFAWQVKPTPAAKGPLKTDFGVELNGTKPTQGFTLGSIAKQVAPIQEAVKEKTKGFKFAMPDLGRYETVDLPGVGKVAGKSLLGGALVLLALLILVAIARNASASKAREERRRKFRTLTDYGRNEMEHDEAPPQSAKVNYVNPMVAAAGGALAGAAVASAVNHHDDHGHDDHGHGHDDHAHGHDDHAHGHDDHAHGHEDHGHGHDDHGHDAHPVKAVAVSGHDHHDDHGHAGDHAHGDHGHGHDDHAHAHDDHHVAPTAGAEALAISGHDAHAADHHDDHGHAGDHGHGHDDHAHGHAEAGHHDDHGHKAHADHKELEHAH